MKKILATTLIFGMLFWAGSAMAIPIFYDNFNGENSGVGMSNYSGFSNWTVDMGSVDLVGGGYWDQLAYDGLSIDLDGSTRDAGILTSNDFNVQIGQTYTLSFDVAGNQRGGADDIFTVGVWDSDYYETFTLAATDVWQTITRDVTVYSDTASIVFNHYGSDNAGALLDNVAFDGAAAPVPEPATMLLMGIGLAGMVAVRRRKKTNNA